jgi:DNA-binding response OmpR family regulator
MRVLVVEDSVLLQRSLRIALRKTGYSTDVAGDGEQGLWMARLGSYDVIVLDWMLPKRDGLQVLQTMRAEGNQTHVLMLTARDSVEERVQGLGTGADDYLIKPFAIEELLARVDSLCRRSYKSKDSRASFGSLTIDFAARSVMRGGVTLELTAREYRLLEFLARQRGKLVSRADIEEHIYDERVTPMSNVVDPAICILRRKISTGEPGEAVIHTRRGLGYMLKPRED